ncbi:hypothetical protein HY640_03765 [Candidatus Woesearchaeota archaeon]|nr:hypothetical protein [Candidatus Woesearchaeota archaeon]
MQSYLGDKSYSELHYARMPRFDEQADPYEMAARRYLELAEYSAEGLILLRNPGLRSAYNPDMQYRRGLGGALAYLEGFREFSELTGASVPVDRVSSTAQRVYGIALENLFFPLVERWGNSSWVHRTRRLANDIKGAVGTELQLQLTPTGAELEKIISFAVARGVPVYNMQDV